MSVPVSRGVELVATAEAEEERLTTSPRILSSDSSNFAGLDTLKKPSGVPSLSASHSAARLGFGLFLSSTSMKEPYLAVYQRGFSSNLAGETPSLIIFV